MKPPLTRPKITPSTRFALLEFLLQLVPGGFAAGAVAAEHRFALRILDAVDIDFDFVADVELGLLARRGEFAQRDAAFALQADVDDRQVILDAR